MQAVNPLAEAGTSLLLSSTLRALAISAAVGLCEPPRVWVTRQRSTCCETPHSLTTAASPSIPLRPASALLTLE